ncbi:MAG: YihY family inner membrane protein [Deltaproteobacteria bacterium]|nr:YihY family inner membrane protein [Deltaproteobacteria bacterium]
MLLVDRLYRAQVRNPALPAHLRLAAKFVAILSRKLVKDAIPVRAGTLSYWTLVALVPVLVLVVLVLDGLGILGSVPLSAFIGADLATRLPDWQSAGLPDELDAKSIGAVGLFVAFMASARIFLAAEEAYNRIWNARVKRPLTSRLALYYATITLAPVIVATGTSLTQHAEEVTRWAVLHNATPVLVTTAAFVFGIRALPDTAVRWRSALVGGLLSALLFEGLKWAFGAYVQLFQSTQATALIYGSLAFVPLFLLYVYAVWSIILLGVVISVVTERWTEMSRAEDRLIEGTERRSPDVLFGLQCLLVLARRFQAGQGPSSEQAINAVLGSDPDHVYAALETLQEAGILEEGESGYVPALPLEKLTVGQALLRYRDRTRPASDRAAPGDDLADRIASHPDFARSIAQVIAA